MLLQKSKIGEDSENEYLFWLKLFVINEVLFLFEELFEIELIFEK